ncbi:hypothetical protein ACFP2T_35885 [Plantactinospora solaniradicis]|uniref:Uncharacterized protein n=1 Tax=Plantactinospora solaniradicis TaxID=1723736 RepID=A0ABW1KKA1_9ACTN
MKLEDLKLPWYSEKNWYWQKCAFQVSLDPGDWVAGLTFGPVVQLGFRYKYVCLSLGPVGLAVMW